MVRAILLAALPLALAWPGVMEMNEKLERRDVEPAAREPLFLSKRPNTGLPTTVFNAEEQYVDVRAGGPNEFRSPGPGDIRGQCPGLNAVANHNFIPRNGRLTTTQTVTGLAKAYGMAADLAIFLAIVSIGLSGDPLTDTWSIGGSFPAAVPLLTGNPSGIAGTHNQYESDASIVRGDAYLNGGSVGVFQMRSWERLYAVADGLTLDTVAGHSDYETRWSKANNPYFFQAPFAGLVSPAAHNFVVHFMSNRSAEAPTGTMTKEILKTFFSVTGEPGKFVHNRGQERIPDNWYRRPSSDPYRLALVVPDVLINNAMYPGIVGIGGNTGTVNSYVGVDTGDLTKGVFNLPNLAEGNNGACFLLQAATQGFPDAADGALGTFKSVLGWATEQLAPLNSQFACPQLADFDSSLFDKFPGASYKAKGL